MQGSEKMLQETNQKNKLSPKCKEDYIFLSKSILDLALMFLEQLNNMLSCKEVELVSLDVDGNL